MRIGGVRVGKVKELELPEEANATRVVMEIDARVRARSPRMRTRPAAEDAARRDLHRAHRGHAVRRATATRSTTRRRRDRRDDRRFDAQRRRRRRAAARGRPPRLEQRGRSRSRSTRSSTPSTRRPARRSSSGCGTRGSRVNGRGQDLNDAFGNIGPFSEDASDVLGTLRRQEEALRGVVRNTGTVFEALTARDQELAGAIVGTNRTFRALASRDEELAETFQIFPTFNSEARLTPRAPRGVRGQRRPAVPRPASRSPATSARPCATCAASLRTRDGCSRTSTR